MWTALNLQSWDEQLINILFPINLLAYMVIQYTFLNYFTDRRYSMLSLVFLVLSNFVIFHATIGYRDITAMYFNCTVIILLILWDQLRMDGLLWLSALWAGFMTFIKLEGIGYLLIYFFLIGAILLTQKAIALRIKLKKLTFFILISSAIFLFYFLYKIFTFPSTGSPKGGLNLDIMNLTFELNAEKLSSAILILKRFLENFFFSGNWNILWVIFFLSLWKYPDRSHNKTIGFLLLALILFLGFYFFSFLLTQHIVWIKDSDIALSRAILHFFPLVIILIILLNFSYKSIKQQE